MPNMGLSTKRAEELLLDIGPNEVSEKKMGWAKTFLLPLISPISLMLLGAAILSRISGRVIDFYFILALYAVNYSLQKWQEFKADRAIRALRSKLAFDVSVLRDGTWQSVNARLLVPGDHIRLGLGSLIPADAQILGVKNLTVNEAVLTGESLPKEKNVGDTIFSGAFIATGSVEAQVTATGKNTAFGKTIFSIEPTMRQSMLERDILSIARFLAFVSIGAVGILTFVFFLKGLPLKELITLDLGLIIAGIPVALPAVMAFILSIGATSLAKKSVIVRRLSALQDLANVNLLLTDKTGTLTKNEIAIVDVISYVSGGSTSELLMHAGYAAAADTPDTIDLAIMKKLEASGIHLDTSRVLNFIPYDSTRKRATALVQEGDERMFISMGAPQVIEAFDDLPSEETRVRYQQDILRAAEAGFRVLAVAINRRDENEEHMTIEGLLFMADPLDEDSKETIHFLRDHGIDVKMVTGDNHLIAERIAHELDLKGEIYADHPIAEVAKKRDALRRFERMGAFAEVLPEDKYAIVNIFKSKYVVAATGDGINDLPALKIAHVSIAVSGAVTALKSVADLVLLGKGLGVIRDAIIESRKIFVRLYNYSVYRISESFRVIISILILGIWYGFYPLDPLQLILLSFLNDIPIISLAVDRVKTATKPAEINVKERLSLSLLFGTVGLINSLIFFAIVKNLMHLSWPIVQTMFFLKLTVSGHMLIFVAHTKERWWRFLPSREVIAATLATQVLATTLAISGFLMPASITLGAAVFVWVWALFWMQISEFMKDVQQRILRTKA